MPEPSTSPDLSSQDRAHEHYLAWVRSLSAQRRHGPDDRLGSLNLLDAAARLRGRDSIRTGQAVSLARPLWPGDDSNGACSITVFERELGPTTVMAGDHIELTCHGLESTHIDALNHMAYDRRWYDGRSADEETPDGVVPTSVIDLADVGIFTRAVHVDIAKGRGVDWVTPDEPVTADDIERCLATSGTTFEPGDALLLDCGRDRYERMHGSLAASPQRGGSGSSAAEWLADARPSLLCWDLLDVANHTDPRGVVHLLHWAIGLVLVDNCDFTQARASFESHGTGTGALVVAPLRIPGATGSCVNPLLIL